MLSIRKAFAKFSANARSQRAQIFRDSFEFGPETRLLDLGSEDGTNIAAVTEGLSLSPNNIFIADIDPYAVEKGSRDHGFTPVLLSDGENLQFDNGSFDIIFCSSVIEHVTVGKDDVWDVTSGQAFKQAAIRSQTRFADEIKRVGRQYFVQTPNRGFPLESHTWLPFAGQMPREIFVPVLKATNIFWPKKSIPDFNLLDSADMQKLFPEAKLILERRFGLVKSIMAVKSDKSIR